MSSSSSSHSRSSSEVLLPGKVDETTNVAEQMAKVVPSDANGHNNQFKERMEQTSFSHINESHVNPMLQGDAPDNPKLHGLHHGPTRVDSLQQPLERLENVDPDEHSLHQIARDGDVDLMVKLLDRLTPSRAAKRLNKKDGDRFTPLHYAARYNHLQMCRLLVSRGADIHAPGEDDVTALHLVAKYKPKKERIDAPDYDSSDGSSEDDGREAQEANLEVLDFLIAAGVRVNGKDFYGLTALHHASVRGNLCCVKKLMDCKGIAIEATDKQQMTPLHIAAIYGHVDIARSLIDSGANIRCRDGDDGTPLQFAAAEGNLQIVKLILEHAKSESRGKLSDMLDERDNDGNTALHLSVDSGHLPVTEYIINCSLINRNTAALNARRNNHETPVHLAARHGHLDIVQLLIRKGAKINTRDDNGSTPLILAAQYNQDAVVEFLITCGSKIELYDVDKFTPLLIACNYGHTETIRRLLHHKANITAVDKNDRGVIYQCAEEDRVDALQELLKHKKAKGLLEVTDRYDNTPLHTAAMKGHFAILKILLDAGAVVDSKNEDEQTPLHLAADGGKLRIIQELVGRKREIVHDDDENGNTALHLAALSGRVQCVRELVRLGASIEARNAKQWTPLDCCASAGMYKSATVLLEADSPVDPKDKRKITPLHLACQQGHQVMVDVLIKWGADMGHRSVDGRNALDFAIDYGRQNCAMSIVESDKWEDALRNRTGDYLTDHKIHTPMRKLIRRMPEVAEVVFRRCLGDNGKHKDHKNYQITFNYEFLDDEFSCTNWLEVEDNVSESSVSMNEGVQRVYDHEGKVNRDIQPYTDDSGLLMENHPLYVMVKSKRESLLRHPLVISLLNHKWKSYGRTFYYTNLSIYIIFMAFLNSYMLTVPPPFVYNTTATIPNVCTSILPVAQDKWGSTCRPNYSGWQPVAAVIILVLAGLNLVKEAFQLFSQRLSYFRSTTNIIEMALYILSILVVINVNDFSRATGMREPWQWQCGAAALFFSWLGLLLFIQNFPRFGIFVLMFNDVLWTFASFFAVFVLFILGFALSFYVLLMNQVAFSQWWKSIIKTSVMMIGEFEYDGIFNSVPTMVSYQAVTYTLFVVFMIIMSIIIMNLLVGLAVDDIKGVQDNAELERLAMQVKLALEVEFTLPQIFRRRFIRQSRSFFPNLHRRKHWIVRWFHSEEHLNHRTIHDALNPEKSDLQLIDTKVETMGRKLGDLRSMVHDMQERNKGLESMLKAIATNLNVEWEENNDDD